MLCVLTFVGTETKEGGVREVLLSSELCFGYKGKTRLRQQVGNSLAEMQLKDLIYYI